MERNINVFVYGTLRKGGRLHSAIAETDFLGNAVTAESNFVMFENGSYPFIKQVAEGTPSSTPIIGEVFAISEEELKRLDYIEGHPFLYERQQIPVILAHNGEITAWAYIFKRDLYGDPVESGDFTKTETFSLFSV